MGNVPKSIQKKTSINTAEGPSSILGKIDIEFSGMDSNGAVKPFKIT